MKSSKTWTKVVRIEEIGATAPSLVELSNREIALYRVEDVIYATDNTCSHAEASPEVQRGGPVLKDGEEARRLTARNYPGL